MNFYRKIFKNNENDEELLKKISENKILHDQQNER
jgi:hypothetical protein